MSAEPFASCSCWGPVFEEPASYENARLCPWWPWPPVTFSWTSVWILMREPRKYTRQYEKIILSVRIRKILPAQKLWKRTNCSLHLPLMIGSIRCLYHYTTYTSAMWSHVEIVLRLASCSRGVQWVVLALA